jgi:dihydroorotate dehydrogenase
MFVYDVVRSLLFRLDAEDVHGATLRALHLASATSLGRSVLRSLFDLRDKRLEVQAFGLTFCNPLGMAGGYDKDGLAVVGLGCLGLGHVEVGTVTYRPQPGNPRPRIFRLPEDTALINTMGFPSQGCEAVAARLRRLPAHPDLRVGVNLGKNKDTPLDQAAEEYRLGLRVLYPYADYFCINISSPNTMGLRQLQSKDYLGNLVGVLTAECAMQRQNTGRRVALLVKLAPDMTWAEVDDALDALLAARVDGIVATNSTCSRSGLKSPLCTLLGGLSGAPIRKMTTDFVAYVSKRVGDRLPIIAAGGVFTADDALEKLAAGATLVQVYTGLVYRGPSMLRDILRGLLTASGRGQALARAAGGGMGTQ